MSTLIKSTIEDYPEKPNNGVTDSQWRIFVDTQTALDFYHAAKALNEARIPKAKRVSPEWVGALGRYAIMGKR